MPRSIATVTILAGLVPAIVGAPSALDASAGPHHPESRVELRIAGETRDGATREIPLTELPIEALSELGCVLVSIDGGDDRPPAATADLASLTLAGGETLSGHVAGGEGEVLSLRLFGDVVLPVDVSSLAAMIFQGRVPEGRTEPLEPPPEFDRLYLRVGGALDTVDGTLEEFTAEGVRFDSRRVGSRLVPWGEVAALFVEVLEESGADAEAGGDPVVVDLVDGSRLRGRMQQLSSAGLDLTVAGKTTISVPLEVLAEIVVDDGTVAFLSDLRPAAVAGLGNPFASAGDGLGMTWPHRADRAVTGDLLRAGGRTWRRGIGVQAPTTLRYALDGSWSELRGAVAVDDLVLLEPADGSVVFRIRLDDRVAWESGVLSAGDAPVAFPSIALGDAESLVLEADMDADLNQGDRGDWLRMMLLR